MTHYDNIPAELRELNQWVCVRTGSKAPMRAVGNRSASSTDRLTWSDFDTARNAVENGSYEYCGFVFADNGIVGVDIDAGYDEDGFISPLAATIINRCRSYTEISKSGRGFHILLKGELPFKGKNNLAGVEIYQTARYFIMTGDVFLYSKLEANQAAIDFVVETYFPEMLRTTKSTGTEPKIYTPEWQAPSDGRIKVTPHYPPIQVGTRNISLTSLAGYMLTVGYSYEDMLKELLYVNATKCVPPLENDEVLTIAKSVGRYERK